MHIFKVVAFGLLVTSSISFAQDLSVEFDRAQILAERQRQDQAEADRMKPKIEGANRAFVRIARALSRALLDEQVFLTSSQILSKQNSSDVTIQQMAVLPNNDHPWADIVITYRKGPALCRIEGRSEVLTTTPWDRWTSTFRKGVAVSVPTCVVTGE